MLILLPLLFYIIPLTRMKLIWLWLNFRRLYCHHCHDADAAKIPLSLRPLLLQCYHSYHAHAAMTLLCRSCHEAVAVMILICINHHCNIPTPRMRELYWSCRRPFNNANATSEMFLKSCKSFICTFWVTSTDVPCFAYIKITCDPKKRRKDSLAANKNFVFCD